jgi:acyl carrier protein
MFVSNTYEELAAVFHDVFDDDTLTPVPEMAAKDVAGWDSVTHIRLMVAIEERYSFRFETNEISDLKNVGALVEIIDRKKKS